MAGAFRDKSVNDSRADELTDPAEKQPRFGRIDTLVNNAGMFIGANAPVFCASWLGMHQKCRGSLPTTDPEMLSGYWRYDRVGGGPILAP
jgi:NAD(P)-dependent dehydrogenase (short-subunit alcohol dehydrogenase family)